MSSNKTIKKFTAITEAENSFLFIRIRHWGLFWAKSATGAYSEPNYFQTYLIKSSFNIIRLYT